jgi:hypothetical protein
MDYRFITPVLPFDQSYKLTDLIPFCFDQCQEIVDEKP